MSVAKSLYWSISFDDEILLWFGVFIVNYLMHPPHDTKYLKTS